MYQLLRRLFFQLPPEQSHILAIGAARWLSQAPFWLNRIQAAAYTDPLFSQQLMGITFSNPLGLAAGFDKNAEAIPTWQALGFGFAEIGTITPVAQSGNPHPRLFRLPADRAILNRMGFNNQGARAIGTYLAAQPPVGIPLGINLGKAKNTPLRDAHQDYVTSFELLQPWGDYFVINVSSPNTPNLRDLQAVDALDLILSSLARVNTTSKPLLVKIAPDLADADICAIVDCCLHHKTAGVIATNTTIGRDGLRTPLLAETQTPPREEAGGISGYPLRARSTEVIRLIWRHTQGALPIVGVGGIASGEDAWEKLCAGASLLQVYTGLVYEGPGLINTILREIADRMRRHQFTHFQQVVGSESSTIGKI